MPTLKNMKHQSRWIAAILTALLLCQEIGYAASSGALASDGALPFLSTETPIRSPKVLEGIFAGFELPEKLGKISTIHIGSSKQFVIHIQDLHVNEEAQLKIARIIDYVASRYGISLIQVEGASGELAHELLSLYPNARARNLAGRSFLKEGAITGAEYLAIAKNPDLILYGIEKKELYEENRQALLEASKLGEGLKINLDDLKKNLDFLAEFIFPRKMRAWLEKKEAFETGKESISDYVHFLAPLCTEEKLACRTVQMARLLKLETLENQARRQEKFKNEKDFERYIQTLVKQDGGLDTGIFDEIKSIEQLLERRFLDPPASSQEIPHVQDTAQLYKLFQILDVYQKMFTLSLNRKNVEFLYQNRDEFAPRKFNSHIQQLADRHSLGINTTPLPFSALQKALTAYENFYRLALRRDEALISGSFESMKLYKKTAAVLITGGFHTPAIEDRLSREGFSFCTITPSIKGKIDFEKDQKLYFKAMQISKSPVANFMGPLDPALQLQIPSRFPGKAEFPAAGGHLNLAGLALSAPHLDYLSAMMIELGAIGLRLGPAVTAGDLESTFKKLSPQETSFLELYRHIHQTGTLINSQGGNAFVPYSAEMGFGLSIKWKQAPVNSSPSQNPRQKSFSFLTHDHIQTDVQILNDPVLAALAQKNFLRTTSKRIPIKNRYHSKTPDAAQLIKNEEEKDRGPVSRSTAEETKALLKRSELRESGAAQPAATSLEPRLDAGGRNFPGLRNIQWADASFTALSLTALYVFIPFSLGSMLASILLLRFGLAFKKLLNEWGHIAVGSVKYRNVLTWNNLAGNRSLKDWLLEIFLFQKTPSAPFVHIPQIAEYDSLRQKIYELQEKEVLNPEDLHQIKLHEAKLDTLRNWDRAVRRLGWLAGAGFAAALTAGAIFLVMTLNPVWSVLALPFIAGALAGLVAAFASDFLSFDVPGFYNCGIFWITLKRLDGETDELYTERMQTILGRLAFFMSLYGSHGIGAAIQFEDPKTGELDYAHFKMPSGYGQNPILYQRSGRTAMVRQFLEYFQGAVESSQREGARAGAIRKIRGHVRLKTSGGEILVETTQPFYINPGHKIRRWQNENGTMTVKEEPNVAYGAANGDTQKARLPGRSEGPYFTEEDWGHFFERAYKVSVGANDSEKAAYFMYFLRTQGSMADSLRLAFVESFFKSIKDTPPDLVQLQKWESALEPLIRKYGTQDWSAPGVMDRLLDEAVKLLPSQAVGVSVPAQDYRNFLSRALTAFQKNDSYYAARLMMSMVNEFSTFGLFYETTLDPGKLTAISREQPVFVAENKDRGIQFGGSNLDFLKWTLRRDPNYKTGDRVQTLTLRMEKETPERGGEIAEVDHETGQVKIFSMIEDRELTSEEVAARWKDITHEKPEWLAPELDDYPMMNDLYASLPASLELHREWRAPSELPLLDHDKTPQETSEVQIAAGKFSQRWAENARSFEEVNAALQRSGIKTPVQHGAPDLFIVVFREENIVVGEWFKKLMKETFGLANIQIVNANEYIRSVESYPLYLNTNTLFLCDNFSETRTAEEHKRRVKQDTGSGTPETAELPGNPADMEATWKVLELLHDRKPPHAFVLTPTQENNVSRALAESHVNVISTKLFPDVDGSAAAPWTQIVSLLELYIHLLRDMRKEFPQGAPLGMTLSTRDIDALDAAYEQMITGGLMDILGLAIGESGEVVHTETTTHENLVRLADDLRPYFTEQARATAASTIHLLIAVAVTGSLIQIAAGLLLSGFGPLWGVPSIILSFLSHLFDVPLFLFFKYMTIRIIRWRENRKGLHRDQTPAVAIGDDLWGRLLRANLSKMFALAKGIISPPAIYDAKQLSEMEGKHGHDVRRGTMIVLSGPPEMAWNDYVNAGHEGVGLFKNQAESFASIEAVGPTMVGIIDHPDASKYRFAHSAVIHSDERDKLRDKDNFDNPELAGRILDIAINGPLSLMAHEVVFVEMIKGIQDLQVGYPLQWDAQDNQNSLRATTTAPIRPPRPVWVKGKEKVKGMREILRQPVKKITADSRPETAGKTKETAPPVSLDFDWGTFSSGSETAVKRSEVRNAGAEKEMSAESWTPGGKMENFFLSAPSPVSKMYRDAKKLAWDLAQSQGALPKNSWGRHQQLAWLMIYAATTDAAQLDLEKTRAVKDAPGMKWEDFFKAVKKYQSSSKDSRSTDVFLDEIIAFSIQSGLFQDTRISKERVHDGLWHPRSGILFNLERQKKLNPQVMETSKKSMENFPVLGNSIPALNAYPRERALFKIAYENPSLGLSKMIPVSGLVSGKIEIKLEALPDQGAMTKIRIFRFQTGGQTWILRTYVLNGRVLAQGNWPKSEKKPATSTPSRREIERQIEDLLSSAEGNPELIRPEHFTRLEALQRMSELALRSEMRTQAAPESETEAAAKELTEATEQKTRQLLRLFEAYKKSLPERIRKEIRDQARPILETTPEKLDVTGLLEKVQAAYLSEIQRLQSFSFFGAARQQVLESIQNQGKGLLNLKKVYQIQTIIEAKTAAIKSHISSMTQNDLYPSFEAELADFGAKLKRARETIAPDNVSEESQLLQGFQNRWNGTTLGELKQLYAARKQVLADQKVLHDLFAQVAALSAQTSISAAALNQAYGLADQVKSAVIKLRPENLDASLQGLIKKLPGTLAALETAYLKGLKERYEGPSGKLALLAGQLQNPGEEKIDALYPREVKQILQALTAEIKRLAGRDVYLRADQTAAGILKGAEMMKVRALFDEQAGAGRLFTNPPVSNPAGQGLENTSADLVFPGAADSGTGRESETETAVTVLLQDTEQKTQLLLQFFDAYKKNLPARIRKESRDLALPLLGTTPERLDVPEFLTRIQETYLDEIQRLKNFSFFGSARQQVLESVQNQRTSLLNLKKVFQIQKDMKNKAAAIRARIAAMNQRDFYPALEEELSVYLMKLNQIRETIPAEKGSEEARLLESLWTRWNGTTVEELKRLHAARKQVLADQKILHDLFTQLAALSVQPSLSAGDLLTAYTLAERTGIAAVKLQPENLDAPLQSLIDDLPRTLAALETTYLHGLKDRYEGASGEFALLTAKLQHPGEEKIDELYQKEVKRLLEALTAEVKQLAGRNVYTRADQTTAGIIKGDELKKVRALFDELTSPGRLFTNPPDSTAADAGTNSTQLLIIPQDETISLDEIFSDAHSAAFTDENRPSSHLPLNLPENEADTALETRGQLTLSDAALQETVPADHGKLLPEADVSESAGDHSGQNKPISPAEPGRPSTAGVSGGFGLGVWLSAVIQWFYSLFTSSKTPDARKRRLEVESLTERLVPSGMDMVNPGGSHDMGAAVWQAEDPQTDPSSLPHTAETVRLTDSTSNRSAPLPMHIDSVFQDQDFGGLFHGVSLETQQDPFSHTSHTGDNAFLFPFSGNAPESLVELHTAALPNPQPPAVHTPGTELTTLDSASGRVSQINITYSVNGTPFEAALTPLYDASGKPQGFLFTESRGGIVTHKLEGHFTEFDSSGRPVAGAVSDGKGFSAEFKFEYPDAVSHSPVGVVTQIKITDPDGSKVTVTIRNEKIFYKTDGDDGGSTDEGKPVTPVNPFGEQHLDNSTQGTFSNSNGGSSAAQTEKADPVEMSRTEDDNEAGLGISPTDALDLLMGGLRGNPSGSAELLIPRSEELPLPEIPLLGVPPLLSDGDNDLPPPAPVIGVSGDPQQLGFPSAAEWNMFDTIAAAILGGSVLYGSAALLLKDRGKKDAARSEVRVSEPRLSWNADGTLLTLSFPQNSGVKILNAAGTEIEELTFQRKGLNYVTSDGLMTAVLDREKGEIRFTSSAAAAENSYRFLVSGATETREYPEFKLKTSIMPAVRPEAGESSARPKKSLLPSPPLKWLAAGLLLSTAGALIAWFAPAIEAGALTPALRWIQNNPSLALYWSTVTAAGIALLTLHGRIHKTGKVLSAGEKVKSAFSRLFFLSVLGAIAYGFLWLQLASPLLLSAAVWVLSASWVMGYFLPKIFMFLSPALILPLRWIPAVAQRFPLKKNMLPSLIGAAALIAFGYLIFRVPSLTNENPEKRVARLTAPLSAADRAPSPDTAAEKKVLPGKEKRPVEPVSFEYTNQVPLLYDTDPGEITVPLLARKEGHLEMDPESHISPADWQNNGKAFKVKGEQPLLRLKRPIVEVKASDTQKLVGYLKDIDRRYAPLYNMGIVSTKDKLFNNASFLIKEIENYNDKQQVLVFGEIHAPFRADEEGWILPGQRPLGTATASTVLARAHSRNRLTVRAAIPITAWQHYDLMKTKVWVILPEGRREARVIRLTAEPRLDGQLILTLGLSSESPIFDWDVRNNRPVPVNFRIEIAPRQELFSYSEKLPQQSQVRSYGELEDRVRIHINPTDAVGRVSFTEKETTWVGPDQLVAGVSGKDRALLKSLVARGEDFSQSARQYLLQLQKLIAMRAVSIAPPEARKFAEDFIMIRELLNRLQFMDSKAPQAGILIGTFNSEGQAVQNQPVAQILTPQIFITQRIEKRFVIEVGEIVILRRPSTGEETLGIVRQVNRELSKRGKDEDSGRYQEIRIETNNSPSLWFADQEYGVEVIYVPVSENAKGQEWLRAHYAHMEKSTAELYTAVNLKTLPRLFPIRFAPPATEEEKRLLVHMLEEPAGTSTAAAEALALRELTPLQLKEQKGEAVLDRPLSSNLEIRRILQESNGEQRRQWMGLFLQNQKIPFEDLQHLVLYGPADAGQMSLDYLLQQRRITDLITLHRALYAKSKDLDMTKLAAAHAVELLESDESSLKRLVQLDPKDAKRAEAQEFFISLLSAKNAAFNPDYAVVVRKILVSDFWRSHAEKMALARALEAGGKKEAGLLVRNAVFAEIALNTGWALGEPQSHAKKTGPVQRYDPRIWDRLHNMEKNDADDRWWLTHSPWVLSASEAPKENFKGRINRLLYEKALAEYERLDEETSKSAAQPITALTLAGRGSLLSDHLFKRLDHLNQREYIQGLSLHGLERFLMISELRQNSKYRERRGQAINRLLNDNSPLARLILARLLIHTNDPDLLWQLANKDAHGILIENSRHLKDSPDTKPGSLIVYQLALARMSGTQFTPDASEGSRRLALRALMDTLSDFELHDLIEGRHGVLLTLKAMGVSENMISITVHEHLSRRATLWAIEQTAEWSHLTLNSQIMTPAESALKNLKESLAVENYDSKRVLTAWAAGMRDHPEIFNRLTELSEFRHEEILKGDNRDQVTHLETSRLSIGLSLGIMGLFAGLVWRVLSGMSSQNSSRKSKKTGARSELRQIPAGLLEAVTAKERLAENLRAGQEFRFSVYEPRAEKLGTDLHAILGISGKALSRLFAAGGKTTNAGEIILNYREDLHTDFFIAQLPELMRTHPGIKQLSIFKAQKTSAARWNLIKTVLRASADFQKLRIVFADEAGMGSLETLTHERLRVRQLSENALVQILEPARLREKERHYYDEVLLEAAPLGKETMLILGGEEPIRGARHMTVEEVVETAFQSYKLITQSA